MQLRGWLAYCTGDFIRTQANKASPHTEYASQLWHSHLQKDINQLQHVQKFALCICAKQWICRAAESF